MRKWRVVFVLVQGALVAAFFLALRSRAVPLGVRGEWEWLRISARPSWFGVLFAAVAVAFYSGFVGLGWRALSVRASLGREAVWLLVLWVFALAVQVLTPGGAPDECDLTRWAYVHYFAGSTGYYRVAKQEIHDPQRFLAEYSDWIRRQDALHIGTHPPGMLMLEFGLLRGMEAHPRTARFVLNALPAVVRDGFRSLDRFGALPLADRAALALTSVLAWMGCAATVIPLYLLARARLPASSAWTAAALWPLVPATVLFQPLADTAFPFLSTSALALAAWAERSERAGPLLATTSGLVLALGMAFTLAFLPAGLIVGIVLATTPKASRKRRALQIGATGAGFLALVLFAWWATNANPFLIGWGNLRNHARFYVEYPRSYRAWVLVNPIEFALALGIPSTFWAVLGFVGFREVPRTAWITLGVLAVLNFSGRNLSEVARLWLPFMPPLLVAAAVGMSRWGVGFQSLALAVGLLGAEVLALEATIQVVYPVAN